VEKLVGKHVKVCSHSKKNVQILTQLYGDSPALKLHVSLRLKVTITALVFDDRFVPPFELSRMMHQPEGRFTESQTILLDLPLLIDLSPSTIPPSHSDTSATTFHA